MSLDHSNTLGGTSAARRWVVPLAVVAAGLVLALLLDRPAFHALRVEDRARLEGRDWYQMLRAAGYLPTWVLIGVAMLFYDTGRPELAAWRRGTFVAGAAVLSGGAAELLKMLIGRERPTHHDGLYVFRPFLGGFADGSNLGLPSSHAAVAFGGAFALAMLMPRVGPVVLLAAAGCGLTRLMSGAHFLSDVYAGGVVAYAVAAGLRRAVGR